VSNVDQSSLGGLLDRVLKPAQRAQRALQRRRKQGPFRGYVDGLTDDGVLRGWVIDTRTNRGRVHIGLYAGSEMLETGYANVVREDVRNATGGEVECGFNIKLSEIAYQKIAEADGHIAVRTQGEPSYEIGSLKLTVDRSDPKLGRSDVAPAFAALQAEFELMEELMEEVPEPDAPLPPIVQPAFERHWKMFTTDKVIPEVPLSGHPAYFDYVRYRYRMDESYEVEPGLESQDRYLYWYLTAYRSQEKRRVPLSRAIIDHLNEPIVMAGQTFTMSRIMWWRMAGRPDMMGGVNLNDRDSYLQALFWWAHQDSPHMYFEDCLIPDRFADLLRGVHPSRRLDAYPLTYFTERYFNDSPRFHFMRPGTPEGRKTLVLSMLVAAVKRPDLLRYMSRNDINRLLAPGEDGMSEFEEFLNEIRPADHETPKQKKAREEAEKKAKAKGRNGADKGAGDSDGKQAADSGAAANGAVPGDHAPDPTDAGTHPETETEAAAGQEDLAPIRMSRARYAAILRKRDFDLDSYRFLTRDRDGNRFEAAALPIPEPDRPEVDVQLIGPLAKASGLGQATRLSADILRETGLSIRGVDFDLDNPAPEGFSSDTLIEDYGPAKINIIHLNAESTPLAFAYQPDVFSGTYNIGYFFWELDKPAYCHYLGMEMLDEIWVSTEYGVDIYKPDAKGKPVVNVGMCYEDNSDISREDSRAFVNRRFRLDDSHFVCLVAFDSFSFVQRKNPVSVLKAFQKAFEGVPNARLIVKTQNRDSVFDPVQVQLWDRVDTIMSSDPRIMVMNETLSYRDLLRLKCGSDCYVSLHKSEGWGFGMIEAMNLRVPVICTAYSGNMDFCSEDTAWLVDYEIRRLRHGEYIFVRRDAEWAEPSIEHAAKQLRAAYDNPAERKRKADAAHEFIRRNFSKQAIAKRYGDRLREILNSGASKP
jgi:glycosyltransferase involved in cell wall biosynthesis